VGCLEEVPRAFVVVGVFYLYQEKAVRPMVRVSSQIQHRDPKGYLDIVLSDHEHDQPASTRTRRLS